MMETYPNHPIADVFPMMREDELVKLAQDILDNGLLNHITLFEGKVLDGRNRIKACAMVDVVPQVAEYAGDDPLGFVISQNKYRRHMTPSQLSATGVDAEKQYAVLARDRQRKAAALARSMADEHKSRKITRADNCVIPPQDPELRKKLGKAICDMHGFPHNDEVGNMMIDIYSKPEPEIDEIKAFKDAKTTYVYFVKDGDKVKIGRSDDPESRVCDLRTGNLDVSLIAQFECPSPKTETVLHKLFAEHRISEEWFRLCPDIERFIAFVNCDKSRFSVHARVMVSKVLGVSTGMIGNAKKLKSESPELFAQVKSGEKTLSQAMRDHTKTKAMANVKPLPDGTYGVLYCDPPWTYDDKLAIDEGDSAYGGAERHYPCMTMTDLKALDVPRLAANRSVMFMWATVPLLPQGLELLKAWGFEYKTHFVWHKMAHNVAHYSSVRHELLLLGTKGSCLPRPVPGTDFYGVAKLIPSVQDIKRTGHSVKPARFREIIDHLYPGGPRIELFSRGDVPDGWNTWGTA